MNVIIIRNKNKYYYNYYYNYFYYNSVRQYNVIAGKFKGNNNRVDLEYKYILWC